MVISLIYTPPFIAVVAQFCRAKDQEPRKVQSVCVQSENVMEFLHHYQLAVWGIAGPVPALNFELGQQSEKDSKKKRKN